MVLRFRLVFPDLGLGVSDMATHGPVNFDRDANMFLCSGSICTGLTHTGCANPGGGTLPMSQSRTVLRELFFNERSWLVADLVNGPSDVAED